MRVIFLASGSKGNSCLIESEKTKILIDLGLSYAMTKNKLKEHDVDIKDIKAVVITHLHKDHTSGLASFLKKRSAIVYTSKQNLKKLNENVNVEKIVIVDTSFNIDDININLFNLSHDLPVVGLLMKIADKEIVYITDTGYINYRHNKLLTNKDVYIVESNYNEDMLLAGPYPYHLRKRIIGDKGHLSNRDCGKFLSEVIGSKTKIICLAHISEHNNTASKAYEEVSQLIMNKFDISNLLVASQDETLVVFKED